MKKCTFILILLVAVSASLLCKKGKEISDKNTDGQPDSTENKMELRYITARAGLRMRDKPDLSGNRIGLIPFGTSVRLKEESGKSLTISGATGRWSKVKWKDRAGWVFGGFLSKNKMEPGITREVLDGKWLKLSSGSSGLYFEVYCDVAIQSYDVSIGGKTISAVYGQDGLIFKITKIIMQHDSITLVTSKKLSNGKMEKLKFRIKDKKRGLVTINGIHYANEKLKSGFKTVIIKLDGKPADDPRYCNSEEYSKEAGLQ